MKARVKRLLQLRAAHYQVGDAEPAPHHVSFFGLWRHATCGEAAAAAGGALLACGAAGALLAAVLLYGELTALFVARWRRAPAPPAPLLRLFAGGAAVPGTERGAHMDALLADSLAFAYASLLVMAVQLAAASAAVWLVSRAAAAMVTRLRLRLLRSVVLQEISFFDTSEDLNFAAVLTEDAEKLRAGVGEHVAMSAYLAGTALGGSALALAYGWRLALAGLGAVPLGAAAAALVSRQQARAAAHEVAAGAAAGRVAEDALAAVRTVRAYAGEETEEARYAAALRGASAAARARGLWAGAGVGLGWFLTYGLNAVVFAYGSALCVRDMHLPPERQEYHPGVMVTVLFCAFMAAQNITMCHPHLEVFATARGAARSLFALLEREPRAGAARRGVRPAAFRGDVSFEDVHFEYPARPGAPVLRGMSLRVAAGETVALVGPSGGGKSTVLQLLQRLYSPARGSITVDGHRLEDLDPDHYRSAVGVVGQEPVLFSGTIRENLALGAGAVSDEDVVAAAKTAQAHQFISQLPSGYDTAVGERGAALSGGQKQRLCIARALLRRPALLLLDEPTSALDPVAEAQVQAALEAARAGRSTLVVSHRLATVQRAARILYVEGGVVHEQGTHAELLALRGRYWDLVRRDLSAAAPSEPEPHERPESPQPARSPSISSRREESRRSVRAGAASAARVPAPAEPPGAPEAAGAAPEDAPRAAAWRLLRLHRPEWPLVAGGALASFLVGATMPAFAYLFSKLYGMFSWSEGEEILAQSRVYAALFAGAAALCGALTFLQAWLFNWAGARLTARLRRLCFRNYLRQEQAWFDEPANAVGALCARLASDCAAVQGATGTRLGAVLQGVSTVALGVLLAALYSWKMTLVSLLAVPCVIGAVRLEGRVSARAEAAERRALEAASRAATEAVLGVRTVRSLGAEAAMLARYAAALREAGAGSAAARRARALCYGLCLCAPTLGYTVSLAYGGYLIAREGLQYEYAILVSEALIYGAWMLAEALSFAPSFAAAARSGARILAALARRPPADSCGELADWSPAGEVSFADVQFSYPRRARVLRGLALRLAAGRTVALVGASGCGKSTALRLLLREYDACAGRVEVDGRDVRALPARQLRAALALVSQEPVLFERSIRDNIAYGDTSRAVPLHEVVAAARAADAHGFVCALPQGYDTAVGGAALSGGQKQRVCIARALLRAPRVLLLDEATSALDAAAERRVAAALRSAARGRSALLVAHRLATVRHADTIAVLERGAVLEAGSHAELLRRGGAYCRLLRQQEPHADDARPPCDSQDKDEVSLDENSRVSVR